jgi:hypothetical protein
MGRLLASVLGATAVSFATPLHHVDLRSAHVPVDALEALTRQERSRQLGRPTLHATVQRPLSPRAGRLLPTALWPEQEIILSASLNDRQGPPLV